MNYTFEDDFLKKLTDLNYFNKRIRKMKNTNNSLLKNSKLQFNKNRIENKINLILNKISEDNILLLVKEFIQNISFITKEEYNIFLELLYNKILKEIQFIDYYLNFFEILAICYYKKLELIPEHFFNQLENKIKNYYLENEYESESELIRKNTLVLLKKLVDRNMLESNLLILINSLVINQSKYISDIYYWFETKKLSNSDEKKLKSILNKSLSFREKVFLNNLLNIENNNTVKNDLNNNNNNKNIEVNDFDNKKIEKNKKENIDDIFKIETINIINEYIYLKLDEEIIEYINSECKNSNQKNIFCKILLEIYFDINFNEKNEIKNLLNKLVKKRVLFKSNLSRGLIYLLKHNKGKRLNDKILKDFSIFLKNMGITKGLEFLLKKFKI